MSIVVLALIVAFIIYLIPKIYHYYQEQVRYNKYAASIPGPQKTYPFGNTLQMPSDTRNHVQYFIDLENEYTSKGQDLITFWIGDRFRIMPLSGESVKDIVDNTAEITKGDEYNILIPWLGVGLLISTGEKWRSRRKLLTPTFHFQMLDGYVDTFNKQSKVLVDLLDNFVDHTRPVDIFAFVKRCALDIICEVAMGYKLKSQIDQSHIYAKTVDDIALIAYKYQMKPWLWLKPIFYITGHTHQYNKYVEILNNMTRTVIHERQQQRLTEKHETGKRKAFLDMLLDMKEQNSLTDEDLKEEVDTFMFEGYDTTSSGIGWILWSLATHAEIQEKVYEELKANLGDDERDIEASDLKNLVYLDMVIKESMRINPPVPFVTRKLINDTTIGGHLCPRECQVLISPLMIHHNEKVWKDHMKFDPERFLPDQVAQRSTYDYIPFSAGPRNCIGQKFALYEEKIVVAWIIRRFRIRGDGELGMNDRVAELTLKPKTGMPIYFERRKPQSTSI